VRQSLGNGAGEDWIAPHAHAGQLNARLRARVRDTLCAFLYRRMLAERFD
jgi:hypothetical protein